MREGIIIAVIIGAFFAALGAIMTALAIKYATPSLLWDLVLWAGVVAMVCSIASLVLFVSARLYGRPFLWPALLISLGLCLVAGGIVWHFSSTANPYAGVVDLAKQLGQNPSNREQLVQALTVKWTQLIETNNAIGNPTDRPLIDEQMRQAFAAVAGNVEARQLFSQSPSLVILLSHNTFLVLYPVVMRVAPNLIWPNLPSGVSPNVINNSPVGFMVIFTPFSASITTLPRVFASAEL